MIDKYRYFDPINKFCAKHTGNIKLCLLNMRVDNFYVSNLQRHRSLFCLVPIPVHALHHWDSFPEKKSIGNASFSLKKNAMIPNRLV